MNRRPAVANNAPVSVDNVKIINLTLLSPGAASTGEADEVMRVHEMFERGNFMP